MLDVTIASCDINAELLNNLSIVQVCDATKDE